MTKLIRYKMLATEEVSEDRRIHVFDMQEQQRLSFNYESLKRTPNSYVGEELAEFLDKRKFKITSGYYDNKKGHAS
ncbi:hypothetical protein SAMN05192559_10178 [Halobacillus karajensis]|uniref:Uncharacterized protein n=1 Tax=Halobacillus karajensis TaxID=195088 RepID=A0A059NYS6_9BACI|nr:hypothetical protein [Halobacillus karajensis]CDQ19269.1 hypothetical protein BN982_01555 [Halobacillus karajensis]CDQ22657.1 hypothetical protein BN983_00871 [Halobacillus karajensis]CDQ26139.1 hypothetical protein BN981_00351 [Halobacillus karajensis]SEH39119.1 hypothetical protein SAMN05192559_10178 [Halobacillus karajensis]